MEAREGSGLTQAELGQRVTLTQTVLSRIESGERAASTEEIAAILEAIGSDKAVALFDALQRRWCFLEPPALDHPGSNLLWRVDQAIALIRSAGNG